jgi:hypothetical protein
MSLAAHVKFTPWSSLLLPKYRPVEVVDKSGRKKTTTKLYYVTTNDAPKGPFVTMVIPGSCGSDKRNIKLAMDTATMQFWALTGRKKDPV